LAKSPITSREAQEGAREKAKKEEKRQRKLENNTSESDDAALDAPETGSPASTE
jgi:hypothetical protein